MSWELVFTKQAQKDALKASKSGLRPKIETLLAFRPWNKPAEHG